MDPSLNFFLIFVNVLKFKEQNGPRRYREMGFRTAVYLLLLAKWSNAQTDVSLDLLQGTIKGVLDEYHNIELYRGVPFATPPTGDLRWKPTVGLEKFSDLGKGDDFQHITKCPQGYEMPDAINRYGEDCLLMNIYR